VNVRTDEDEFAKDEFVRTEYFNDFLKPQDIHSCLIVRLGRRDGMMATLNVSRPDRCEQFGGADLERLVAIPVHRVARIESFIDDLIRQDLADLDGFADALRAGEPATGTVAMDLAEAHRRHISRWFYDCDYAAHRGLADIYTADDRYIATYDEIEPGLALYVRDAMYANANRGQGQGQIHVG